MMGRDYKPLHWIMNMKRFICTWLLIAGCVPLLKAQSDSPADSVTANVKNIYAISGDQQEVITNNLKFPNDVEISTNVTFKVGKGKDRTLLEGQVLLREGWLLSPDGSVQPVFDHVVMKEARVMVVRDGRAEAITQPMNFPNGLSLTPDGYRSFPDGRRARLVDGEWFHLDGTRIPCKDAATLINGRVVLQKDGSLISLQTVQIMGMNDGTRVFGDGTVQKLSGETFKLREGQTILIDGRKLDY
jgi:hypothetical protein